MISKPKDIMHRAATIGMFDGVHTGHKHLLGQLSQLARDLDLTPTVVTFDRHPLEVIAPERTPGILTTPAQRTDLFLDAGVHDVLIMVFNKHMREMTAQEFMQMLHDSYGVKALLVGFNHRFGSDTGRSVDEYVDLGSDVGVEVHVATEYTDPARSSTVSSSAVRRLVAEGDIEQANRLLGHRLAIRGHIVHGQHRGNAIGYPTANLQPVLKRQLLPKDGVYAATATIGDSRPYKAIVNVGTNPTVNRGEITAPRLEAHLLGYNGKAYGQPMEVRFIRRIRDERRFDNVDDLRAQIARDCAEAFNI